MKHFQSVPDWSTQASQAMHGRLFSRGGKQGLPLYVDEEKPPPIDLKNDWLANEIMSASFVCQRTHVMEIKKATRKKPLLSGILSGPI